MIKKNFFFFYIFLFIVLTFSPKASAQVRLREVRYNTGSDKTRIVIEIDKISRYSASRISPDAISLSIPELRSTLNQNLWTVNDGLVKNISYSRPKIVINLETACDYHISSLRNPPRVVIDISRKKTDFSAEQASSVFLKTVVIDAGHGGKDVGAIGPTGLMEKTVTLDMAKRVKEILERQGVNVILTRGKDEFVSLQRRVAIANTAGVDLFLSIHCNASFSSYARGFESYFLSPATDDLARAVEAVENSVILLEPNSSNKTKEFLTLLADLKYTEYRKESKMFAEMIQTNLGIAFSAPNRGVKSALFYVLRGLEAPAILAEVGFISNPDEEKLLRNYSHRQLLAENLAESVLQFKKAFDISAGFTK
jgi:N-acetylmuramoyl-L-alanine amidase